MDKRWLTLARHLAIKPEVAERVWHGLAAAYGADGRFYHNLTHIQHTLDIADQLRSVAADFTVVQLALWFHDVVYDPRHRDNEAQSAAYMERVLHPLGVPDAMLATVSDLILATKNHETAVPNPNIFVILDADLAILSAPPAHYDAYAQAIRQEYAFVPDEAYRAGRTAVLQRFVARSPFYFTEWMQERGDAAVYENINRELEKLTSK